MEFGVNIGLNLIAFKYLFPGGKFTSVEINKNAYIELKKLKCMNIYDDLILTFIRKARYDVSFVETGLYYKNNDMFILCLNLSLYIVCA